MKIKIILLWIILLLLSLNVFAQKQTPAAAVENFYRFHFSRESIFDRREVLLRSRFFTPRLKQLFNAELKRQRIYLSKYPDNKPFFEGLPFEPIEFCANDYQVGEAQYNRQSANVPVYFVYKSSCEAKDGTRISYKILLKKITGKWLIDDVVYDDGSTLRQAFNTAQKIK